MNKIDIVIATYKSYGYLERCLSSIYEDSSSRRFVQDIIVVDNAPSSAYWSSPPKVFEHVTVLSNSKNLGFAQAVNLGIKKCSAPYILLLNPDTRIHQSMIHRSVAFMDQHPRVGIMGPKILNEDSSIQGSARGFPNYSTLLFGRASPLNRIFPDNPWTRRNIPCLYMLNNGKDSYDVDWVSGAAATIRRDAIREIGYLDEQFFMYWEDADLCQRMRKAGWDVVYYPYPEVTHLLEKCTEQDFILNLARFHKSAFLLEQKQERNRWAGHMVLVALALEFHFLARLLWRGAQGWTKPVKAGVPPDKIRILRIIARLNIGGPAIHVALLTNGLDARRFQSTLIAGRVSSQEGDMSYLFDGFDEKPIMIPELQREPNFIKDLRSLYLVYKILRRERPDIVHTHTAKAGAIGRIAVFLHNLIHGKKVRVVHTFHGHVFRGYFGKLKSLFFLRVERLLARIADVIIAISESQKSELSSKYHIAPTSKFRVVELGFDLEHFFSAKRLRGTFRRSLGLDSKEILVGIVGRLVSIKNHKMFLKAAKIFMDHNPDIPARFLIIGDGELRDSLVTFCNKQGLSGYVKFCGWEYDLSKVYADIDILCLTSKNEGTPVSIIEAMASSVPVISTDAGGVQDLLGTPVREISENGFRVLERGVLCGQDNPEGFANGLQYVIQNKSVREEISNSARSFISHMYSKERLLQDIESVYLELMKRDPLATDSHRHAQ
jgi:GT2 family glycosyltransferase